MARHDVQFLVGAASLAQVPQDPLPRVVMAGPSNVGKSSLINALLGQDVARVSRTPGRTQQLNFFRVDERFLLVDLPGYGFAKAPRGVQQRFLRLVEEYLSAEQRLALFVLLLDSRRDPSEHDLAIIKWLSASQVPHVVALTKADKLRHGERARRPAEIRAGLGPTESATWIRAVSAQTGDGCRELWQAVESHVSA